jgi:CheY-like chemotaxis protein
MIGRPRVLVAENDALLAQALELTLGDLGYEVCGTARSAREAVRLAEELRPDMAVLDVGLEGPGDGLAATQYLTRRLALPVIVCSAHARGADATAAGAAAFLEKPFRVEQLRGALGRPAFPVPLAANRVRLAS